MTTTCSITPFSGASIRLLHQMPSESRSVQSRLWIIRKQRSDHHRLLLWIITEGVADCGGEINVENGTFNPWQFSIMSRPSDWTHYAQSALHCFRNARRFCQSRKTPAALRRSCLSVVDKKRARFSMRLLGKTEVYHLCVITDKCYGACTYNARGDYASVFSSSTHATGGFLAVLIGYASSAAIIWQAALSPEPPLHKSLAG